MQTAPTTTTPAIEEPVIKRAELRVKIKSLADESRTIRAEERRASGSTRNSLHHHRKHVVGVESRATYVAYAFMRGMAYSRVERNPRFYGPMDRPGPDWTRVIAIVMKFSDIQMIEMAKSKAHRHQAIFDLIKVWRTT